MANYIDHDQLIQLQKERINYYKSEDRKNLLVTAMLLCVITIVIITVTIIFYYSDNKGLTENGNYNVSSIESVKKGTKNV